MLRCPKGTTGDLSTGQNQGKSGTTELNPVVVYILMGHPFYPWRGAPSWYTFGALRPTR
jgi:hypothetical protein